MTASTPAETVAPDAATATSLPRHIAIIMDGNNRWAKLRELPGNEGHRAGELALRQVVELAAKVPVDVLTVFAFSSENWRRPPDEVAALMQLFLFALDARVQELDRARIRLRFIGDRSAFSSELQAGMQVAEAKTAHHTRMTLIIAVNYGGQWDMAQAAQRLAAQVEKGELKAADITPERLAGMVEMSDLPPVDLLIRTGGELRISNFVLWQAAYAELHFSDALWPDFGHKHLQAALEDYAQRQRRFGRTSEQIEALHA
ncbi:polyprenyl diphosphate synthase [Paraperlucidibaca wandonensis]|jgi:undecaprenyl diphosphate synthase|uniref:Ditrans,polycis-undecaprenyl-diphosphate synthase ((2E,6E)-farnesyl-diphosphate specific) n=1 Tax=Paraperlucidibaca wandonensis TaxID=1268273 RepID=A0ABW3HED8_9GAMM|nr:di-trans,poly-cis-decaprenylcistransferase [Paraperlucidibaca sp.]MBQ0723296.1 di-trans,poly-cis-decaprenylcistransferase [Paraperlucidibaca sp.]MBQ0842535.1 di-trans,poly-cis-decaprenylcistransferase [Paraperlucidibaca sp.]